MRPLGLRGRLVLTTVLVAVGTATVLVVGLQVFLARQSSRDSLADLRNRADAVAATVRFHTGRPHVLDPAPDSLDQGIWVFDAAGSRIDGTRPPRQLRDEVARLSHSTHEVSLVVHDHYRLLARPVQAPASSAPGAVVVAAQRLQPYESAERRTLVASLLLVLLAVVAAGGAAWVASGSALAQVRRMARRADEWREHDLTGRFDLGAPRDELTELADTLDRMLDRIAQVILAERRLTDEVAHELRTPLTVIRTEAELARMSPAPDGSHDAFTSILAATERMTGSIETMLAVARAAQSDEEACDAAELMRQARVHLDHAERLTVEVVDPEPAMVVGAPLRVVAAALTPLLDNALRHAQSRIAVRVEAQERQVVVSVVDDGPGVPEELGDRVFEPGVTTGSDGAGLGLALARRLAHSVGGEVEAVTGAGGHFRLRLPRG
jgi:signal transduction histidine kinase